MDFTPLTVFRVFPGKRYRFRLVSGGSQYCPFQLQVSSGKTIHMGNSPMFSEQTQIDKHRMTVISTDGGAVKPHTVDTLISISGERYDFVINTNQQPSKLFNWN